MPSRADTRRTLEWVMRIALLAGLAFALWRSLRPPESSRITRRSDARGLATALADASRSARVSGIDVDIDSTPDRTARAWLAALRRAGVAVGWQGGGPPLAVQVERG